MAITILKSNKFSEFEGEAVLSLFDQTVKIYIEEGADLEYAELCVAYVNSLSEEIVSSLCEASIRYCNEFLDDIGEDVMTFSKPTDVLTHITPNTMCIQKPKDKTKPVVDIELNCTWEEEHGMEWIIRDDKVMYVGAYNAINVYGDCDRYGEWNYAYPKQGE